MKPVQPGYENAFGALRQFIRPRRRDVERCELCSAEVATEHAHLIEPGRRKLLCSCNACAILFSAMGTKYKRVPRRVLVLADFHLSDGQWESLMVPISMAFFFRSTPDARVVAFYPSPAGATESLLPLETWTDIEDANPVLQELESDVEALLVNRVGYARGFAAPEYYVLPIDECYKLVGLIRSSWRGLSGGTEVWQRIGGFFDGLKQRATVIREDAHA
ncbi:MAG TPA: DUF5947 family protein [Candidatus Acidoferrales bacterium]|jgi:hypothetical protein|nr:DUF5947 family protein [Candidatus Acidoferrales bacterium]